jgi:hypothetical protein
MTVTLEWDPATGQVQIRCEADRCPDKSFGYLVDPREAALAFNHPFAMRPAGIGGATDDETRAPRPPRAPGRWRRWLGPREESGPDSNHRDYSWPCWLEACHD